ncbi:MAG: YcgN family cysteine cluster protein [Pseudomonadales bacterium]|nr:YcgN family cysteine cluster protein [Pseudomonadales bacterium]
MAFWEEKTLQQMTADEWEALCDGCGKCCLHKLEYEESGEIAYTNVACQYLDNQSCRCQHYEKRFEKVPDCVDLQPGNIATFKWLPESCAYRLLSEGKPLYDWHPLVSGNKDSVHLAGKSVKDRFLSERFVHPEGLEEHIVNWIM